MDKHMKNQSSTIIKSTVSLNIKWSVKNLKKKKELKSFLHLVLYYDVATMTSDVNRGSLELESASGGMLLSTFQSQISTGTQAIIKNTQMKFSLDLPRT